MDLAYDHIAEESLPEAEEGKNTGTAPASTLNADLQAAYSAFSASPWASRIGGFFGNVVKQSESVYREAQQEVTALGQDATKGLTDLRDSLVNRTRGLSVSGPPAGSEASWGTATGDAQATPTGTASSSSAALDEATVLARIKGEAAKRLRDLQRAEDAADEALVKFGTNLRDFLRDAITIAPPTDDGTGSSSGGAVRRVPGGSNGAGGSSTLLFESRDAQGKRVIHTSRFDAQLHVIHTNPESFAKDPAANNAEFAAWAASFAIADKTDDIAADLDKYPELRVTMEKLVPDKIPYADFWKRYYFLRHGIETAEARRRDLLRAASTEEEVAWDEDSDDEAGAAGKAPQLAPVRPSSTGSSTTIHPPPATAAAGATVAGTDVAAEGLLKPLGGPRKSDEKSQADSEASYDIVGAKSGAPSQAPNSPRRVDEDSEEEDWE